MLRLAALLSLAALPLAAQDSASVPANDPGLHISPAFGVHYGIPLRASAALGVLMDRTARKNDGVAVIAEVGERGGQLSVGYFRMFGWFGSGYSLSGTVLRTGDDPWNAAERTTYVGGELQVMLLLGVGGRIGYLKRASRSGPDPHDTIVPLTLSIGF